MGEGGERNRGIGACLAPAPEVLNRGFVIEEQASKVGIEGRPSKVGIEG